MEPRQAAAKNTGKARGLARSSSDQTSQLPLSWQPWPWPWLQPLNSRDLLALEWSQSCLQLSVAQSACDRANGGDSATGGCSWGSVPECRKGIPVGGGGSKMALSHLHSTHHYNPARGAFPQNPAIGLSLTVNSGLSR